MEAPTALLGDTGGTALFGNLGAPCAVQHVECAVAKPVEEVDFALFSCGGFVGQASLRSYTHLNLFLIEAIASFNYAGICGVSDVGIGSGIGSTDVAAQHDVGDVRSSGNFGTNEEVECMQVEATPLVQASSCYSAPANGGGASLRLSDSPEHFCLSSGGARDLCDFQAVRAVSSEVSQSYVSQLSCSGPAHRGDGGGDGSHGSVPLSPIPPWLVQLRIFNAANVLRGAVPAQLLQAAVRGESAGCEDFLPPRRLTRNARRRLARFGGRAFGAFSARTAGTQHDAAAAAAEDSLVGGSVSLVGVGVGEARVAALAAPVPDGLLSDAVRIRDAAIAAFRAGDLPRLRQAVLDADALRATVAA